jgi:ribulose-phosphate 3-epimerase
MAHIIPAILTTDIKDAQKKLDELAGLVDRVQIDLMDGEFVNNFSIKPEEVRQLKTKIDLEAHLMVREPQKWLAYLNPDFFKRVYFHIETAPKPRALIKELKVKGCQIGLALNLETPIAVIEPFVKKIDSVLFMSVTPGRQGQSFSELVLDKVRQFKQKYPDKIAAIDGGVNESNIRSVVSAGADDIYVGSALFKKGKIEKNLNKLRKLI